MTAFTYIGSRGTNLPVLRADQQHPDAVPVDVAHPRHRERDVPDGQRAEPVRGPAAGQHDQRRHRRSASSCCGRSRSSARSAIEEYDGSDRYRRGHGAAREALPQRQLAHRAVHALVAARQAELPQPAGRRARGSRLAERSAEPLLDRHQPAAAVRPRTSSGARTGTALVDAIARRLAGERHVSVPVRLPADRGPPARTTTRRAAIRRA